MSKPFPADDFETLTPAPICPVCSTPGRCDMCRDMVQPLSASDAYNIRAHIIANSMQPK